MSSPLSVPMASIQLAQSNAHDIGVREIAALSARLAYVLMCLTLCWGILTATGWVRRLSGHHALRGGHIMLAAFTLATGVTHALCFVFLNQQIFTAAEFIVPVIGGAQFRHTLGIIGLELMIAITIGVGLRRWVVYRRWLRFHQLAYPAVALTVVHSWLGAIANGHLSMVWLGGITVLVPAVTLTVLRFLPPRLLIRARLLESAPAGQTELSRSTVVRVSVDNQRCGRYAICQAEAPAVFRLAEDGRLQYDRAPDEGQTDQVRAAARSCPMRAIQLQGPRK